MKTPVKPLSITSKKIIKQKRFPIDFIIIEIAEGVQSGRAALMPRSSGTVWNE
jgi:hypothetical protein